MFEEILKTATIPMTVTGKCFISILAEDGRKPPKNICLEMVVLSNYMWG